jgi:hypothetical protein
VLVVVVKSTIDVLVIDVVVFVSTIGFFLSSAWLCNMMCNYVKWNILGTIYRIGLFLTAISSSPFYFNCNLLVGGMMKERESGRHTYVLNGNDGGFMVALLSKEIARVQYDDDDNCKETNDDFVLPSRTLMNYQARLSFDRLISLSFCLSLVRSFFSLNVCCV